jgi:hypothetical protein
MESSNQVLLSHVYHNGELYSARIRKDQLEGCELNFHEMDPKSLPVFGEIYHTSIVFRMKPAGEGVNLLKQKFESDSLGRVQVDEKQRSQTYRLVLSAELETSHVNTPNVIGMGRARYPMIYRASSGEQMIQELLRPDFSLREMKVRNIRSSDNKDTEYCWNLLKSMIDDAKNAKKEQLARASGDERRSSFKYHSLGMNCVCLSARNMLRAGMGHREAMRIRCPSLPKTLLHKDDWIKPQAGFYLEPERDFNPYLESGWGAAVPIRRALPVDVENNDH